MRLDTIMFGMVITDAWKAYRNETTDKKTLGIVEFADRLTYDMLNNEEVDSLNPTFIAAGDASESESSVPLTVEVPNGGGTDPLPLLSLITAVSMSSILRDHTYTVNPEMEKTPCIRTGNCRPGRRTCQKTGCKDQTHYCCEDYRCKKKVQNPNGMVVYGTFYCMKHWADHHQEVYALYEGGLLS